MPKKITGAFVATTALLWSSGIDKPGGELCFLALPPVFPLLVYTILFMLFLGLLTLAIILPRGTTVRGNI